MKKLKKSTPAIQEEELIEWNRYKRYSELILKDNERKLFEIHRIKTDVLNAEMIAKKK